MSLAATAEIEDEVGENERDVNHDRSSIDSTLIVRPELQRHLLDLLAKISDQDLADLTEEQADQLWDWMEVGADPHNSIIDDQWFSTIPDFMVVGETVEDGDLAEEAREILLKRDPQELVEEKKPVEEPAAADKTSLHLADIMEANDKAKRLRKIFDDACSDVRAAKGREKEAREDLDNAEKNLSQIIDDAKSGQGRLPFGDTGDSGDLQVVKICETKDLEKVLFAKTPISELGAKAIKTLVGADEFDAAKDREDPIGLSDSQLEKFVQVDVSTIEGLEQFMRDDEWWHKKIKGFGDSAIQRVISTLTAYRLKNPVPNRTR